MNPHSLLWTDVGELLLGIEQSSVDIFDLGAQRPDQDAGMPLRAKEMAVLGKVPPSGIQLFGSRRRVKPEIGAKRPRQVAGGL